MLHKFFNDTKINYKIQGVVTAAEMFYADFSVRLCNILVLITYNNFFRSYLELFKKLMRVFK